ncbi:MAG: GDYXXLXY domain-containing protein [Clostridia bacterium]|nr:GDYXXLXY domain-containing protein [Clostridia bacterium]
MKKIKFETSIIFLIIPFLIVLGMLIYNSVLNTTGEEMYFKMTGYDPYDSLRGRYLSLSFDFDELAIPDACGYIYMEDMKDKEIFQKPIDNFNETYNRKVKANFDFYSSDAKFLMVLESLTDEQKDDVYNVLQYYVDLMVQDEEAKKNILNHTYYDNEIAVDSIFNKLSNIDLRFELVSDTHQDLDYAIKYTFMRLLSAIGNSNITAKEFFDQIEYRYYLENELNLSDYVYYYLIFEKDENEIAQIKTVALNKDEAKESGLPYVKVRTYRRYVALDSVRISDEEKEYYIDERIADHADSALSYATSNGQDIYVKSKVKNNGIQFKQVYINNMTLEDYVEDYIINVSKEY